MSRVTVSLLLRENWKRFAASAVPVCADPSNVERCLDLLAWAGTCNRVPTSLDDADKKVFAAFRAVAEAFDTSNLGRRRFLTGALRTLSVEVQHILDGAGE